MQTLCPSCVYVSSRLPLAFYCASGSGRRFIKRRFKTASARGCWGRSGSFHTGWKPLWFPSVQLIISAYIFSLRETIWNSRITKMKSQRWKAREQILIEQKGQMDRNEDSGVWKHQCQLLWLHWSTLEGVCVLSCFSDKYSRNVFAGTAEERLGKH